MKFTYLVHLATTLTKSSILGTAAKRCYIKAIAFGRRYLGQERLRVIGVDVVKGD